MMSISALFFFGLVGHATATAVGEPYAALTGGTVGIKPTKITLGGTTDTDLAGGDTIVFTPSAAIFIQSQSSVLVTITTGADGTTALAACSPGTGTAGATSTATVPVFTVTLPSSCAVVAGKIRVEIAVAAAIAVTLDQASTFTMIATGHEVSANGDITPVPGLASATKDPNCLSIGDVPEDIIIGATTGNDDASVLTKDTPIVVTSDKKIFEASKTLGASNLALTSGFTNCAVTGVTSAATIPTLTLTLTDSTTTACTVAKATVFTVTVKNAQGPAGESMANSNILAATPDLGVIISIQGAGTSVAANTAYTPLRAPSLSTVAVNNQKNGVKPTSIIFGFKISTTALDKNAAIVVAPKNPADAVANAMLTAGATSAKAATIKTGSTAATVVTSTTCTATYTTDSSAVMTLTLADIATSACSITASHYVAIEVSTAADIAVNPSNVGLGAMITIGSIASCLPYKYQSTGTAVTLPTMTYATDGAWTGGAKATNALAALGKIYFMVDTGLFKAQTVAKTVTLTGSEFCSGTAVSTTDTMTVTLADSATTCAIAAAGIFTVKATFADFQAARPTADAIRQGWVWTSADVAARHGEAALTTGTVSFTHKSESTTTTTTTNTTNNTNSTTVGVLITGSIRFHAPTSMICIILFFLTTAMM